MNAQECLLLCRYVKAGAPHQHMDEYTPDVWFDILKDIEFDDAREAVKDHLKYNNFVSPSDIRAGVRSRYNRINRVPEGW